MKIFNNSLGAALASAVMLIPGLVSAQDKTFEKISQLPEVQYVYISESMLSSVGEMVENPGFNIGPAIEHLKSLEVLSCSDTTSFDKVRGMLSPRIETLPLLAKKQDDKEDIEIYGSRKGDRLTNMLFVMEDSLKLSAIYLTGSIDPELLRSISKVNK